MNDTRCDSIAPRMLGLIQRIIGAFKERRDTGHAWGCAGNSNADRNREAFRTNDGTTFLYVAQQSLGGH